MTVNQVIQLLGALLGRSLRVEYLGTEHGDVRHTSANTQWAARVLGYTPRVSLKAGLAAEIAWIQGCVQFTRGEVASMATATATGVF